MPSQRLLTATFAHKSGLAKDQVTNTFAVVSFAAPAAGDIVAMQDAVANFYKTLATGQVATLASYLSPELDRTGSPLTVRAYNIDGNLHAIPVRDGGVPNGSPVAIKSYTLPAAGSATPLPSEVSLAVTIEALARATSPVEAPDGIDPDTLIDRPKQRRTGRFYIGPLNDTTRATGTLSESRPSGAFRLDVMNAVKGLNAAMIAIGLTTCNLGVWSRKDGAVRALEAVSCDDAWDTQRRRGVAPTARGRIALP